eukprot:371245-Rhodomonas_salina.1
MGHKVAPLNGLGGLAHMGAREIKCDYPQKRHTVAPPLYSFVGITWGKGSDAQARASGGNCVTS